MEEFNLVDFELDIRSYLEGFRFYVYFRLREVRKPYSHSGIATSPGECYEMAMAFLAAMVREAA
jgi:hypothetical protein